MTSTNTQKSMFFQRYKKRANAAEMILPHLFSLSVQAWDSCAVINGDKFKCIQVTDNIALEVWLIQREKICSDLSENSVARFKYLRAD